MDIVLASQSPRRFLLLKKILKDFTVYPANVDERGILEKNPIRFAIQAAKLKSKIVANRFKNSVVIGADTIVVLDGKIFGKPKNKQEAKRILNALSGRTHQVITAVVCCCKRKDKLVMGHETTRVTFKKLKNKDIETYLNKGDFKDKAGSYAIQDTFDDFIEKIEGDYDNVIGLPIRLVKGLLNNFIDIPKD